MQSTGQRVPQGTGCNPAQSAPLPSTVLEVLRVAPGHTGALVPNGCAAFRLVGRAALPARGLPLLLWAVTVGSLPGRPPVHTWGFCWS